MVTAAQKKKQEEDEAAAKAAAKADAKDDTKDDAVEPATEDQKKADDERRALRDGDADVQEEGVMDTDSARHADRPSRESTAIAQPAGPDFSTTEDAQGVDRIVAVGVQDGWKPAPVEPDEDAVKKAEARLKREEEDAEARREGRIDPVSGKLLSKEEYAKVNAERDEPAKTDSDKS